MPIISFDRNPNASIERKMQSLKESTQRALDELQNELKNELQNSASTEPSDESNSQGGQDGKDGKDGFSPTVVVTEITGGHRVSITDVHGVKTFDVMDGADGQDGADGISGGISYEVGDVVVTSTNENPSARFGGTWELFDKSLKKNYISSSDAVTAINKTNATDIEVMASIVDHMLEIIVGVTLAKAMGETNLEFGALNFEALGVTRVSNTVYSVSATDDANGASLMALSYSGAITGYDVFPKGTGTTIASGAKVRGVFTCTVSDDVMLDEFCDKFFWKKTA